MTSDEITLEMLGRSSSNAGSANMMLRLIETFVCSSTVFKWAVNVGCELIFGRARFESRFFKGHFGQKCMSKFHGYFEFVNF